MRAPFSTRGVNPRSTYQKVGSQSHLYDRPARNPSHQAPFQAKRHGQLRATCAWHGCGRQHCRLSWNRCTQRESPLLRPQPVFGLAGEYRGFLGDAHLTHAQNPHAFSGRADKRKPPECRQQAQPAVSNRSKRANAYALSFARPLARRLFRILRPALVAIRARNPWRFLRTRFDGWNVRFIAFSPVRGQTPEGIRSRSTFQTCPLERRPLHVNARSPLKLQQFQ